MTNNLWKKQLKALGPCPEAYRWACQYTTLRQAWRACERADWMRFLVWSADPKGMQGEAYKTMIAIGELGDEGGREWGLCTTYMFLDFMPDPPQLP